MRRMTLEPGDVWPCVGGEEGPFAPRSSFRKEAKTGVAMASRAAILE